MLQAGGLHILGTERHESRRIDNQLRGRSGRQGDPGSSRFYLSLEDDLLRIFGSDRISGVLDKLGMDEDEPIEHNMISKAIENAQRKVEGHNFEGFMLDISPAGAFIETGEAFTAGQQIQLAFSLPNNPGQLAITGEILWNGKLGIGLQFKEFSRKQMDLITAFMAEK